MGQRGGFTLLEVGLVLVILSIITSATLAALLQHNRIAAQVEVQSKLDEIAEAMISFHKSNKRLPCPSDGTIGIESQYFGVEAANQGLCTGGGPTANFSDGANTVGGVVPIRTLGIPDDALFDPWGGRISYFVDSRATKSGALAAFSVSDPEIGNISIQDVWTVNTIDEVNTRTVHAIAVVLSHGPNGHGAFQQSGVRKSSGSTSHGEQQNCHCNSGLAPIPFDATFVMKANVSHPSDPLNNFDDIVRYFLREQLLSGPEVEIESP